jgi:NAD(P)-dependent dehydrogenase (short-subunit alcohol dehydrogenase family)
MDLDGKVALVTGAASGIGQAVAEALARAGASVSVLGRSEASNTETLDRIRGVCGRALGVAADVTEDGDVRAAVACTVETFGALHIAICCAGVEAESGLLEDLTISDYTRIFDVHVKGTFLTLKHTLPAIAEAGGGSIATTASTGGVVAFPRAPLYCAAKHAVVGLTKVAALDYAHRRVRVNSVAPSAVDTPMLERFIGGRTTVREQLAAAHPNGRVASASEIAECFLWLASERSSYVTGHTLVADGGYTTG